MRAILAYTGSVFIVLLALCGILIPFLFVISDLGREWTLNLPIFISSLVFILPSAYLLFLELGLLKTMRAKKVPEKKFIFRRKLLIVILAAILLLSIAFVWSFNGLDCRPECVNQSEVDRIDKLFGLLILLLISTLILGLKGPSLYMKSISSSRPN